MQLHYSNSHQATPINELWEVANEPQRRLAALSIRPFSFNAVFSRDAVIFGKRRNSRSTWIPDPTRKEGEEVIFFSLIHT